MSYRDDFHALLVGIDFYLPSAAAGLTYPKLRGCVADVRSLRAHLVDHLRVPEQQICTLTAANERGDAPREPAARRPTYEQLVAGLRWLRDRAGPGDQVLFFYAGHGGRTPALHPELKPNGFDECLVPWDIARPQARYLRDLELAFEVKSMADRGVQVTVILDCCHAGGAGRDIAWRGVSFVDPTPRSASSLVAAPEQLAATWRALSRAGYRDLSLGSGWLPDAPGFVLLAACQASQQAFLGCFDGRVRGVFSHWLVDSLHRLGPKTTYKALHDRILTKVHSRYETQTPVLEGDGARIVFGKDRGGPRYGAPIFEIEPRGRVLLGAGRAHGTKPGDLFAVPPSPDGDHPSARRALLEVSDAIDATVCWARILEPSRPDRHLSAADLAVPVATAIRCRREVYLSSALDRSFQQEVEQRLEASGFLLLTDKSADLHVVEVDAAIELQDPAGEPLLRLGSGRDTAVLVDHLAHLARYRNVQELDHASQAVDLDLMLSSLPCGWQAGRGVSAQELEPMTAPYRVSDGEWLCLTVRNLSPRRFHFAVLDLRPDWTIRQIVPQAGFTSTLLLEPGVAASLPLRARHAGAPRRREILKVFASTTATDFRWLELPSLGVAPPARGLPLHPLEKLFFQLIVHPPATRALRPRVHRGWDGWAVAQVELEVLPKPKDHPRQTRSADSPEKTPARDSPDSRARE